MAQPHGVRYPGKHKSKVLESRSGSAPPLDSDFSGTTSSLSALILANGSQNFDERQNLGHSTELGGSIPDYVDNSFGPSYCCDIETSGHSPDGVSFLMSTMPKQDVLAKERSLSNSFSENDILRLVDTISSSPSTTNSHVNAVSERSKVNEKPNFPVSVKPVVMSPAVSNDYFAHETGISWDEEEDEDSAINRKPLTSPSPVTDMPTTFKISSLPIPDVTIPFSNGSIPLHAHAVNPFSVTSSQDRPQNMLCGSTSPVVPESFNADVRHDTHDHWRSRSAPPVDGINMFQPFQQPMMMTGDFIMQPNPLFLPFAMMNQNSSFAISPLYPINPQQYNPNQQFKPRGNQSGSNEGKRHRGGRGRSNYDQRHRMRGQDNYDFNQGNPEESDEAFSMSQPSPSSLSSSGNHHVTVAVDCDKVLEEFKNSNGRNRVWSLADIFDHVPEFCKDQHGSRFIQQQLETCSNTDKSRVFDEVIDHGGSLISDVFGNYVIQKLLELGSSKHQMAVASWITGHVVSLSLQMYGCRVVQKVMDVVDEVTLCSLVMEIGNNVTMCVYDQNGNHVIQKSIEMLSKASKIPLPQDLMTKILSCISLITFGMIGHVREMSLHPYGCRVIQRVLEYCAQEFKLQIVLEIRQRVNDLMFDQFGNYVIQHMMAFGSAVDKSFLVQQVMDNLVICAQHKFASNVVEKCLVYASRQEKHILIDTILRGYVDPSRYDVSRLGLNHLPRILDVLIRDQFGNYVVQRLMEVADEEHQADLIRYVKENFNSLRKYTYGKHIIGRVEKLTERR